MNSENKKINKLYDDYKYFLYKNLSQYTMIAIINRLKKCEKIREEISLQLNSFYNIEFEKRTFWDRVKILRLLKEYRNTKVQWDLLEKNLKQYYGYRINNEFYINFLILLRKRIFNSLQNRILGIRHAKKNSFIQFRCHS